MRLVWTVIFVVLSIIGHARHHVKGEEKGKDTRHYLNHWVVEIKGGERQAKEVAAQHGFQVERPLVSLPDHYSIKRSDVPHRSKRSASHHTQRLSEDARVEFVEQQHEIKREKRGHFYNRDLATFIVRSTGQTNDPERSSQWYIASNGNSEAHTKMRVREAWRKGLSGKGVCVTILDDGIEKTHKDLAPNYSPSCSYDFNDHDDDPSPRYEPTNENKHGTRCAGEVAMVANNGICGVGIAYNAGIGGVRMLDGKVTDSVEGESIGFGHKVNITSASWGPNDDGTTLEGPGRLATKGIMRSITEGRGGLGTILVWAAGNGAHLGDNCNCDGYTSNIHTLSVSSASERGNSPWYSEKCSSTLTATYSSGTNGERKIVSADLHGKCTHEHTGTSAAAPLAAGIIALALENNPGLTWRDVQHLVVFCSNPESLLKNEGWYKNGIGLCANHAFGFGLMNAECMVTMADQNTWEHVGKQKTCRVKSSDADLPQNLASGKEIEVEIETDGCHGQDEEINFLEHVSVIFTLDYSRRGNIYVELESPSGTITPLMFERAHDKSKDGFQKWPLISVHTWGENPNGTWKLRVADKDENGNQHGELKDVELVLFGTKEKPFYHGNIDKKCSQEKTYPRINPRQLRDSKDEIKRIFEGHWFDLE